MASSNNTEEINLIPTEMLQLIPHYGGDMMQLNLFLRQCEYVISKYGGSRAQNTYVMHSIMSRLVDRAAALISEHEEIETWADFKKLFSQHFGDPRSEECIYMELQSMKIKQGESYFEFCNRIKSVRRALVAKISLNTDSHLKRGKISIYDEIALEVFLYNLPEKIVDNVRFKSPKTLEDALTLVLEEVSFQERYNTRKGIFTSQHPGMPPMNRLGNYNLQSGAGFTFGVPQNTSRPQLGQGTSFGSQPQGDPRPPRILNTQQSGARSKLFGGSSLQFGTGTQSSGNTLFGAAFGANKPVEKTSKESNSTTEVASRTVNLPEKQEEFKVNEFDFVLAEPNE